MNINNRLKSSENKLVDTKAVTDVLNVLIEKSNSIILISAFLTGSVLKLFKKSDYDKDISLYVRCRPSDCISGSCDLDVLKQLISKGINCYADYKLHAKIYIFDSKNAVIGSSNLTANGLGFSNYPNFELNYSCELSPADLAQINTYLAQCVQISVDDIKKMQQEIANISTTSSADIPIEWKTIDLKPRERLAGLFIEDFPKCNPFELSSYDSKDINHDESMFGKEQLDKAKFEQSNVCKFIYQFISEQEDKSASFGAITAHLHNNILDDFSPYRSDIKTYLQNFIFYLEHYKCKSLIVSKYRYRQVVSIN